MGMSNYPWVGGRRQRKSAHTLLENEIQPADKMGGGAEHFLDRGSSLCLCHADTTKEFSWNEREECDTLKESRPEKHNSSVQFVCVETV